MKWLKLISEANKTPSNMEEIEKSFSGDVSDEKFTPTEEFVRNVYGKMNKELFFNYLPPTNEVKIEFFSDVKSVDIAIAECNFIGTEKAHIPTDFKLLVNIARVFTIHTWMEIILHEMIHILDYVDHPENFTENKNYAAHGEWFEKMALKFKKIGFNIEQYYSGGIDMNDDIDFSEILENELFIQVGVAKDGTPKVCKISKDDKQKIIKALTKLGLEKTTIFKSSNPLSAEIPLLRGIKNASRPASYYMDDDFVSEYGPFEEVETIDLKKPITEDSLDDEILSCMRSVEGVVYAHKIGKDKYRIGIS